MDMAQRLYESGSLVESSTPGRFRIRIITEGEGSTGVYTRELIENYADVFAGRPMFGNHPKDPNKPWERSPFEIKAKLASSVTVEEVDGVVGAYADVVASPDVQKFMEDFHDVIGVSIFASGDGSQKNENDKLIVESFDGSDPYTSVDFVVAPGRGGGVERMVEAYRVLEQNGSAPAGTGEHEGEYRMDEATKAFIEQMFAPVRETLAELNTKLDNATALVESVQKAQPERVDAVDAAGELATAVAEAKLGERAVARVLEAVKGGAAVTDAVKHEKEIRDEVLAEAGTRLQEGVFGGSATDDHDYGLSSVRFN